MKNFSEKPFIIICVIALVAVIIGAMYWSSHSTDYEYDDEWIIGKNEYQVIERYGEFDIQFDENGRGGFSRGYCVKPMSYDKLFGEPIWPEYYMIYFDEQGIAYETKIKVGGVGG